MTQKDWIKHQLIGEEDAVRELYEPERWNYADTIKINKFREILLWPIYVEPEGAAKSKDGIPALMRSIAQGLADHKPQERSTGLEDCCKNHWYPVNDPLQHIDRPPDQSQDAFRNAQYAELVYFHEVIQAFLYKPNKTASSGKGLDDSCALQLFRRDDIESIHLELAYNCTPGSAGPLHVAFAVDRCNLYLASTGIMLLALEVSWDHSTNQTEPLRLADVQNILNEFRRCHAPYFDKWAKEDKEDKEDQPAFRPGQCPLSVTIKHAWGKSPLECKYSCVVDGLSQRDATLAIGEDTDGKRNRKPQIFGHWADLLWPFILSNKSVGSSKKPYCYDKAKGGQEFSLQQIVDERIPFMSYISLTQDHVKQSDGPERITEISRGDWMRLCFADSPGNSAMPYNPHFLSGFEAKHCYDRFFASDAAPDYSVRLTFSGYAFNAVGGGDFFDDTLEEHFRRHYFQIALLVYLEQSSLLGFSKRLTGIVSDFDRAGAPTGSSKEKAEAQQTFHEQVSRLKREFLQYTHRFRFTGISNQLQPSEMYDQWRDVMGLKPLFDDVKEELDAASDFLLAVDQKQQADAASVLGVVATIGVVLGVVLGFFGMNAFFSETPLNSLFNESEQYSWLSFLTDATAVFFALILSCIATWGLICWVTPAPLKKLHHVVKIKGSLRAVALASAFAALAGAIAMLPSVKDQIAFTSQPTSEQSQSQASQTPETALDGKDLNSEQTEKQE
nr:hypothetical protein [uncultured Cohaesibacter sp.]